MMKTLVVFYSYTGASKRLAVTYADGEGADTMEIHDKKRPSAIRAYVSGCFKAMRATAWDIQAPERSADDYEKIVLFTPIWAGNTPPAMNAFLQLLPAGKTVSVKAVSASGKSSCAARIEEVVRQKGCSFDGFEDIKSNA